MPDIMVALYDEYDTAVRARTELVADGFATDRVDITSSQEPGQAALGPDNDPRGNLQDHFQRLFEDTGDQRSADELTQAVLDGASALTVHPRGTVEIERAREILERYRPNEIHRHFDRNQNRDGLTGERAAGPPR